MYLDKAVVFQLNPVNIVLITSRNTVSICLHVVYIAILVPVLPAVPGPDDGLLASPHSLASTDLDIRLTLSWLDSTFSMIILMQTRSIFYFHVFVNIFWMLDIIPGVSRPRLALRLPRPGPVVAGGHSEGDHQGEGGAQHNPGRHVQWSDQGYLDKCFNAI